MAFFEKKIKKANLHLSIESSKKLLLGDDTPFAVKEAYNRLRTNINYMKKSDDCQVIAVTSSVPGEAKTTTSINLAISMGMSGKKTLIIDADMRKPRAGTILGYGNKPGLSEYLAAIHKNAEIYETDYENCFVLGAGYCPPNPAELLSDSRMKELIEYLKTQYEVIVIDTPPITVVADSTVLKDVVDGYLITVHSAMTSNKVITESVRLLQQIDASIYGFVLTYQVHKNKSSYGYYGYYENK